MKSARNPLSVESILFRFFAIAISLVAVALLSEVALRLFERHDGIIRRFDHDLGWVPLENVGQHGVHQNQFGLRGPDDMQLEKTSGRKRILVLGDSYVWGLSASQDDIFTSPRVHGTNDEFINCGVCGYGTDQEYLFYLRTCQKFDVDQVVLVFTPDNDVTNNVASAQYTYLKPYFTLNDGELVLHNDHVRYNIIYAFNRECRLWNVIREGVDGLSHTLRPKREPKYADPNAVVSDADRAGIELTLALIKKLKEAVTAHHAEFYVVFIPQTSRIHKHMPANHPFAPLIAAGLTQMGVHYREPYPEFLKSAIAGVELFHPPDGHFNAAGHALFAKFLTDTDLARASTDYYAHQ
ncbi:MAG TPA: hypothetical protein VLK27_10115 [Chthoniobacterales bacterium]|nr:hypothetical protein [Chthoniobacterales bacterium]